MEATLLAEERVGRPAGERVRRQQRERRLLVDRALRREDPPRRVFVLLLEATLPAAAEGQAEVLRRDVRRWRCGGSRR